MAASRTPDLRFFLPPHLLRRIAGHADDPACDSAGDTLACDATFRTLRTEHAAERRATKPRSGSSTRLGQAAIRIHDAGHAQTLPGELRRSADAPPSGDPAVDEAWEGLAATRAFLADVLDRHSIDDEGMVLRATVHFGRNYMNAFWDGSQMVFGDGDGRLFRRFTGSIDVVAHELAHGVIADEGRLAYVYEPGALNESLADVFGSLVRQYRLGQAAHEADWLVGAGLFGPAVRGEALRSMRFPGRAYDDPVLGRDLQPAHMDAFVRTHRDNGGVHINSGIPSRAFVLAALGIGGHAWEGAGRIWYEALRDERVVPTTDFRAFARVTQATAARLFGAESRAWRAVTDAWRQVGVD